MDTSIVIAQVLGIFFALVGLSMIANSKGTAQAMEESVNNKGILWLWGFMAILIGGIIVVLNDYWTSGLSLLVTVIGWIALIKGAFILFFPNYAAALYKKFNKSGVLLFCGVIALIIGFILLYW